MTSNDLFSHRSDFYLVPPQQVKGGIVAGVLLGALTLVAGFMAADPGRVWGSLMMNVFFFFSIALGGVVFSGVQDVVGALWGRPIKRIHEAFAAFLPVAALILGAMLVCILLDVGHARDVFVWMKNPQMLDHFPGKNIWLQPRFMAIRDLGALVVIVLLSTWQVRVGLKRDQAFIKGSSNTTSQEALLARDKLRYWCAPILFVYALCYTLLTFDLIMSLSPLWFSTLWAGWLFAIMMQTLMATLLVFMFALKGTRIGQMYQQSQFHDVGKLMHGFTVFFAYLTYAHVLTYWFGNVPEETEYFIERLQAPWFWIVVIAPFFNFVIPLYTLIFKAAKWTAPVTLTLCAMILVAQWFVYVLVFVPSIAGHHWTAGWIDFGLLALVASLFMLSFTTFARKFPLIAVGDVLLKEALSGDHH